MVQSRSWFRFAVTVLLFVAASAVNVKADDKPIRAYFVIGGCCHDYAAQKDLLTQGISARANVTWTIAYDPDKTTAHMNPVYENPDWAAGYDVVVHDECSSDVKDLAVIDASCDRIAKDCRQSSCIAVCTATAARATRTRSRRGSSSPAYPRPGTDRNCPSQ